MTEEIFRGTSPRRIGDKVFRMNKELWKECLDKGVTEKDILYYKQRYNTMGIPVNQQVAALRAIEEKVIRSRKGGRE